MARKGTKKDKPAKAPRPEATQEIFNIFLAEYSEKRQAVDDANATMRGTLKRAKAAGLSTKMLIQVRAEQRMDRTKLAAEIAEEAKYRAWAALPVGAQPPLFEDDVAFDTDLSHEDQMRQAGERGLAVGKAGGDRDANPHEAGSVLHQAFDISWLEGRKEYQAEESGSKASRRRSSSSVAHEAAGHA